MAEYIEREAAHRMVAGLVRYSWKSPISTERRSTLDADDVNFGLDKIPAAAVAPVVHGQWGLLPISIRSVKKTNIPEAVCSICGGRFCDITNSVSLYQFCPNCGAKMDLD